MCYLKYTKWKESQVVWQGRQNGVAEGPSCTNILAKRMCLFFPLLFTYLFLLLDLGGQNRALK